PFLDEAASVVMRTAFTLIVNDLAVSEQRPLKLIDCWQVTESQVMNEHGRSVRYVVWTAAKIDHLQAGHSFLQSNCTGRIRARFNQTSIPGAGADRKAGRGVPADLSRYIERSASANCAIDTVIRSRDRAFNNH